MKPVQIILLFIVFFTCSCEQEKFNEYVLNEDLRKNIDIFLKYLSSKIDTTNSKERNLIIKSQCNSYKTYLNIDHTCYYGIFSCKNSIIRVIKFHDYNIFLLNDLPNNIIMDTNNIFQKEEILKLFFRDEYSLYVSNGIEPVPEPPSDIASMVLTFNKQSLIFSAIGYFSFPDYAINPKGCIYWDSLNVDVYSSPDTSLIYRYVDTPPEFPGGSDSLKNILLRITENQVRKDIKQKYSGSISISYVVETDGTTSLIDINNNFDEDNEEYIEEYIKAFKTMPKWIPGKQKGVNVRVQKGVLIKINFTTKNVKISI